MTPNAMMQWFNELLTRFATGLSCNNKFTRFSFRISLFYYTNVKKNLLTLRKYKNHKGTAHAQYAKARCYPKKRCLAFEFKFKKFSIKQAIFIIENFSSRVKAHTQKNLKVFFRCFFKVFVRLCL